METKLNTLCIKWDFDQFTKNYYFCNLNFTGGLYAVDFSRLSRFNLTCVQAASCINVFQAENNCPIFISDSCNSFLFFKNDGPCDLYFKFSSLPISSGYVDFSCYKYSGIYCFQKCNYLLKKDESIFLSLDVDKDGSKYFSKAFYGFGFFYDVPNIKSLISNSNNSINYGFYTDVCGLYYPINSYEFELTSGIFQCGKCPSCATSSGVYFCNFESYENLCLADYNSLVFDECSRLNFISPNSENYDFLNLSGCFNFEIVATPENGTQERIFMGRGGGSNGWGSNGQAWYTVFNVDGFGMGMSLGGGNFQSIGFPLTGSGLTPYLNTGCFYHLMMASDGCCFSIYINGVRQGYADCSTCSIAPYLYPSNTNSCTFIIGANTTNNPEKFFKGNIRSIKFSTGQFPYCIDINNNFDYPTGALDFNNETLFFIQPEEKNIQKRHSYSSCLNVLSGSIFDIHFCKTGNYEIKCEISSITNFGNNSLSGFTKINNISIYDDNGILSEDIYQNGYCFTVNCDKNICIYLNLSSNNSKDYNYYYLNTGNQNSSSQCVFFNSCIICDSITSNCIQNYSTSNSNLTLSLNLCNNFSIKDIKTKSFDRCNLFLPDRNLFLEKYSFELGDSNYSFETGISGYWCESFNIDTGYFINCISLISTEESEYLTNCSDNFYVNIDFFESRKNTNSIVCKTGLYNSEPYEVYFSNCENSFFYSGLEYRYNPIEKILYRGSDLQIDGCLNISLSVTGKTINFDFPLNAINYQSLKITDDNEIIDYVDSVFYNLSYSGICFNHTIKESNFSCFNFPKIRNENLSGVESPQVDIEINSCLKLQNNFKLYLDPYRCFSDDLNYGLNNFLFFIISELNNGLVYCCSYSGIEYGTSDYNLLMLELKDEYYSCNYILPSGSGSFLINESITLNDFNYNIPISFKNITGNGYNYILPIVTGFYLYESGNNNNLSGYVNEINYGNENPLNFSCYYSSITGGSTGFFCFIDESGNLTGSGYLFNNNSCIFLNKNTIQFSFEKEDIEQTQSGKNLFLQRNFDFSGIQPINIISNYNLLCLSSPIKTTNLVNYTPNTNLNYVCSIFYYMYNLNNPVHSKIKIFSPESTFICSICWTDENSDNVINSSDAAIGQNRLSCNVAFLKLKLDGAIYENKYNFSFDSPYSVCIEIRGDI
jgi:hypothetical protein